MKRFLIEATFYTMLAVGVGLIIGSQIVGCSPAPAQAQSEPYTAAETVEIVQYDPCKDSLLYLERGLEGQERKKECGVG